jgi:hypothetical protein
MRIFENLVGLSPADFQDLADASTPELLGAQASTAAFLAELGEDTTTLTTDQLHNARAAFAAVTNPNLPNAQTQDAILKLRVPPAVQHLAGMLSQYDWAYVEQAKELRGFVVAKLLEESKHPDAKIRLRAVELIGKLTEVASFTERKEVVHKNASADELESRIRAKLATLLPRTLEVETIETLPVKDVAAKDEPC